MSSSIQKEQIDDYWSHSLKSVFHKTVAKNKYGSVAEKLNNECNSYSANYFIKKIYCLTSLI